MGSAGLKDKVRALKSERGVSMAEFLVYILMLGLLAAAGSALLIVAVKNQPRITSRDDAIQQGRILQERFARELRLSSNVVTATASQITFDTYLRRTQCGGAVPTDPATPAIVCRITYSCTTGGTCSRTEAPLSGQPGTTVTAQLVTGLSSNAVFAYSPDATTPTYVTTRLIFPAKGGDDAVTLDDGVQLRNRSS